jgi:hypothetical protein
MKCVAPVFLAVGALHLAIGVKADVLLGAKLPVEALADPTLDSQNRFYGVAFTLYGVLLFLCASNIPKYATRASLPDLGVLCGRTRKDCFACSSRLAATTGVSTSGE